MSAVQTSVGSSFQHLNRKTTLGFFLVMQKQKAETNMGTETVQSTVSCPV